MIKKRLNSAPATKQSSTASAEVLIKKIFGNNRKSELKFPSGHTPAHEKVSAIGGSEQSVGPLRRNIDGVKLSGTVGPCDKEAGRKSFKTTGGGENLWRGRSRSRSGDSLESWKMQKISQHLQQTNHEQDE